MELTQNKTLPELEFHPGMEVSDRYDSLDIRRLYLQYFRKISNIIELEGIDTKAFKVFFEEKYAANIVKEYFKKTINKKGKESFDHRIFVLVGEILLGIDGGDVLLACEFSENPMVQELISDVKNFRKKKKKKAELCMIVNGQFGLNTRSIKFKKPKIDLAQNYNDGFADAHTNFLEQLKMKSDSGLFLFHGKPGTGKSTYIRYLIKKSRKKSIFMSPRMAGSLDQSSLTKLLLSNKNCILIIEDAEELVVSRNSGRNSNLSMILNLTDGILGECLGIQIIATFNTALKNIDPALMRKGRLKASYEFKELSVLKANKLLEQQGIEAVANQPMTLADIYNFTNNDGDNQPFKKAVGFRD